MKTVCVVFLMLMLSACGRAISVSGYETSQSMCSNYGGLVHVYSSKWDGDYVATCKDGMRITFPFK